jgi:5-methylcytosine-specific restriction endonuclease McrA
MIFLGPKCVYCGNEDIDLLDIDHKKDNGSQDRQWSKDTGLRLFSFYWNNLADAYMNLQVLCIKCHKLKSRGILKQSHIEEKLNNEVKQLTKKTKK